MGTLSVGWQQRVEILKALYREARILVLDEPTAVLTPQETVEIFGVLRRLAAEGHSIVFISHKLNEVLDIADRITVIRRGKVVGQRRPGETDEDDLAELMVGARSSSPSIAGESHPAEVMLRVEDLQVTNDRGSQAVRGVSLEVRAARSWASPAWPAMGRTSSWRPSWACASASRDDPARRRGRHRISPRQMHEAGGSYVPADRHRFGLVLWRFPSPTTSS